MQQLHKKLEKAVQLSFYALFFFLPLIFFPQTVEIFEFNKIVFLYAMTAVIMTLWLMICISRTSLAYRRTILDIPLLVFLVSQGMSTLYSIDIHTSLFGYYGRFNGGLISLLSYALLYWAFVSLMDKTNTIKALKMMLASSVLVGLIGFFEHFGVSFTCLAVAGADSTASNSGILGMAQSFYQSFDPHCWAQDFQARVFSTLGQPNWLAAYMAALIPVAVALSLRAKALHAKVFLYPTLTALLTIVLLYTKSRSGLAGLGVGILLYAVLSLGTAKNVKAVWQKQKKVIVTAALAVLALLAIIGTPWTPSLSDLRNGNEEDLSHISTIVITDSLTIRKNVWDAALSIWQQYPMWGPGVETFAIMFPRFKPVAHNLTSEWDFVFNKAHNEYLNYLATTGSVGLISYLLLIGVTLYSFYKASKQKTPIIPLALLAGYMTLLITQFFGFSVVITSFLFFLFPALAITVSSEEIKTKEVSLSAVQKTAIALSSLVSLFVVTQIGTYWYADYLSAKALRVKSDGQLVEARSYALESVKYNKDEAFYWIELASISSTLAVQLTETHEDKAAALMTSTSIEEAKTARGLSPANINIMSRQASNYIRLAGVDPLYIAEARGVLETATTLGPHDPELLYNLGLAMIRTGDPEKAEQTWQNAVTIKENYKEPRYALALLYANDGSYDEALIQLDYILAKIDPADSDAIRKKLEIEESL